MRGGKVFIFIFVGVVVFASLVVVGVMLGLSLNKQSEEAFVFTKKESDENTQVIERFQVQVERDEVGGNSQVVSGDCPALEIPAGYKIASGKDLFGREKLISTSSQPLVFQLDLDEDGEKERVRVLIEALSRQDRFSFRRGKPVVIEVLKEQAGCVERVFRFDGRSDSERDSSGFGWRNGNEILSVFAISDFWGDGRSVFVFVPVATNYGSGYTAYVNILVFDSGRYRIIQGPVLDELGSFRFSAGSAPGNAIWKAAGIWADGEAHFDPHRCRIERWDWQKNLFSYQRQEIGVSKNKYDNCRVEDILSRENLL